MLSSGLSLPNDIQSYKLCSKGKVAPAVSVKAYRGRTGIALLIHNFGNSWRRIVNFTSRPRRKAPVPTEQETLWAPEPV
jgi:hypothetical protein